jgi:hypothetical protein
MKLVFDPLERALADMTPRAIPGAEIGGGPRPFRNVRAASAHRGIKHRYLEAQVRSHTAVGCSSMHDGN